MKTTDVSALQIEAGGGAAPGVSPVYSENAEGILSALNAAAEKRQNLDRILPAWIAIGLWCSLYTLFTVQSAIVFSLSWPVAAKHSLYFWGLWMIFIPAAAWLAFRYPPEQPDLQRRILLHIVGCLITIGTLQIAYRTLLPLPPRPTDQRSHVSASSPPPPPGMRVGFDILIYGMTVSVSAALAHFRRSQDKERRAVELEARLAQARLQTLRMQLNPHFLFNTLNAISTLVHTRPQVADEMITDLADLLRFSLESPGRQEVQLAHELDLLQRYLSIEQRRFGDRLQIRQSVADSTLSTLVPTLLLQPIVENAIKHGIEPQGGPGIITITSALEGRKVVLRITDNGRGIQDNAAPTGSGIGLSNTRARLEQLYGDRQYFTVGNAPEGGCVVEIKMPFHTTPVQPEDGPAVS